jgi:hypothetical protein
LIEGSRDFREEALPEDFMKKHTITISGLLAIVLLIGCGGGYLPHTSRPPAALAITSIALPGGTVGISYDGAGFSLTASGGVAPYSWSWTAVAGSSLPAGLNLSRSGLISGTPQVAVTYDVTVTVTDSSSQPATVSLDYQITVADVLTITSGAPPNGIVGVDYGPTLTQYERCDPTGITPTSYRCIPCIPSVSCPFHKCVGLPPVNMPCVTIKHIFQGFTFAAAGGIGPYTWSASGMPPGIDVDPSSGQILGTPTSAGSYSVLITVTDTASPPVQASGTYVIDIN